MTLSFNVAFTNLCLGFPGGSVVKRLCTAGCVVFSVVREFPHAMCSKTKKKKKKSLPESQ